LPARKPNQPQISTVSHQAAQSLCLCLCSTGDQGWRGGG